MNLLKFYKIYCSFMQRHKSIIFQSVCMEPSPTSAAGTALSRTSVAVTHFTSTLCASQTPAPSPSQNWATPIMVARFTKVCTWCLLFPPCQFGPRGGKSSPAVVSKPLQPGLLAAWPGSDASLFKARSHYKRYIGNQIIDISDLNRRGSQVTFDWSFGL